MKLYKSLRFRIFLSMLLLLVLTFVALSVLTGIQYRKSRRLPPGTTAAQSQYQGKYQLRPQEHHLSRGTDMIPLIFKTRSMRLRTSTISKSTSTILKATCQSSPDYRF
ncbi:MAG: hypothetical protein R2773_04245 [Flavobacteriaceae bacterium]